MVTKTFSIPRFAARFQLGTSIAVDCGSAEIASQTDAEALKACPTITGNVVLATNAAGDIKLNGVGVIEGNFTSQQYCFDNSPFVTVTYDYQRYGLEANCVIWKCSGLLLFNSSMLVSVSKNLTLQNLINISSISVTAAESIGQPFYLDGLPALTNLAIPKLTSVGISMLRCPDLDRDGSGQLGNPFFSLYQ
jgi:hypothetical protein